MSNPSAKRLAEFLSEIDPKAEPTQSIRNFVLPGEILILRARKKITDGEFILLGVIDNLVKAKEEGCWASRGYLARKVGKTERQVHRMIARLLKIGIIRQVGTKSFPNGATVPTYETLWHPVNLLDKLECTDVRGCHKCHPGGCHKCHPSISSLRSEMIRENPSRRNRRDRGRDDPSRQSPPGGTTDMPFPEFGAEPDTKIKDHHTAWAERLRKACVQNGWKHEWSRKKWANQFRILEDKLAKKELGRLVPGDIEKVLAWFERIAPTKTREVQHAEHFRKSFPHLHRWATENEKVDVQVSKEAKEIADQFRGRFSNYKWPNGSGDQLDAFVQVTLTNARAFRDSLKEVAVHGDKENMAGMLLRMRHFYFDHPDTFTEKWVKAVYDDVKDWAGWSGNLLAMAFTGDLNQKRMDRIGKQWATDYYGNDKQWTKLKESLS